MSRQTIINEWESARVETEIERINRRISEAEYSARQHSNAAVAASSALTYAKQLEHAVGFLLSVVRSGEFVPAQTVDQVLAYMAKHEGS